MQAHTHTHTVVGLQLFKTVFAALSPLLGSASEGSQLSQCKKLHRVNIMMMPFVSSKLTISDRLHPKMYTGHG